MTPTVGTVMTRDIYAVALDTSIETAARLLTARHIGGAPVVAPDGKPIGVLSLFDLVDPDRPRTPGSGHSLFYKIDDGRLELLGDAKELSDGKVADVMSPFVLAVDEGASVLVAAKLMLAENVHRLLVIDHERLVGIVTMTDLLRAFVGSQA